MMQSVHKYRQRGVQQAVRQRRDVRFRGFEFFPF